jgi:hypothetical protein
MLRYLAFSLAMAGMLAAGGKKEPATGRGETETVEVTATLYPDKDSIKQLLGTDLDGYYTVVDVRVMSRFGKEIEVRRDDFLLRTDKDGEKSGPLAPSQIAGRGTLVISESGSGGAAVARENNGPIWGGSPGTTDRPQRLPGSGATFGGGGGGTVEQKATAQSGGGRDVPPLQKLLQEKILPEGKTDKSLSGLLYFPLEKQKVKDLELVYTAPDGKMTLRFKQQQ